MLHVDDRPETLHIYVVREEALKPSLFPIFLSMLSLIIVVLVAVLSPYREPVTRAVIRVPAVLLPIKTFTAQVAIIPTGIRVYPATTAHGVLTITNGSIIGQSIPAGFTIQGVAIDSAVYVPGGSANGYGWATVSAHALISGKGGNFATFSINQVEGSSVFIRNLSAFSGGRDSYSVKFVTAQDKLSTLIKARSEVTMQIDGLHYPCKEAYKNSIYKAQLQMTVTWRCQFVTYQLPTFMHVTGVRISGKNLVISIWFVPRPVRYWAK